MSRQAYHTDRVVVLPAPLSNAVRSGNLLFVSGITPFDINREVAIGDFPAQMRQVMESIRIILEDNGITRDKWTPDLVRRAEMARGWEIG